MTATVRLANLAYFFDIFHVPSSADGHEWIACACGRTVQTGLLRGVLLKASGEGSDSRVSCFSWIDLSIPMLGAQPLRRWTGSCLWGRTSPQLLGELYGHDGHASVSLYIGGVVFSMSHTDRLASRNEIPEAAKIWPIPEASSPRARRVVRRPSPKHAHQMTPRCFGTCARRVACGQKCSGIALESPLKSSTSDFRSGHTMTERR